MWSEDRVREAVFEHYQAWNAGDRERWLAAFDEHVSWEDPVGTPPKIGIVEVAGIWERARALGSWTFGPTFLAICGNQVGAYVTNIGNMGGTLMLGNSVEIWTVTPALKIGRYQGYFAISPQLRDIHRAVVAHE